MYHTSEDDLQISLYRVEGGGGVKIRQATILPHCQLGTFAIGIPNPCLHSGLECPTNLWSANRHPPTLPHFLLGSTYIKIRSGTLTYRNGQTKRKTESTEDTPKNPQNAVSGIFSVLWGYFLGFQRFRPGVVFFGILCGNSGSGHLGAL